MAILDTGWKDQRIGIPAAASTVGELPIVALVLWIVLLAFAGTMYATIVGAQAQPEELQRLEEMTIRPPAGSLESRDALLRLLLERGTPCLGCDAVQVEQARTSSLLDYLVVGTPREVDDGRRFAIEVRHMDEGPEMELTRQ